MARQLHIQRDVTLAAVAKDAVSCGAYRTALDNADQIADAAVHDSAVLVLVRDALAYGVYDQAFEAAARLRTDKARRRGIGELCDQAKRFGHFEIATRAALLMTAAPPSSSAPAPSRTGTAAGAPTAEQTATDAESRAASSLAPLAVGRSGRGAMCVWGACGVTAALWGVGFALHGHNLHEFVTTQVDNLAVSAFLMTGSAVGAVVYDWLGKRR